MDGHYVQLNTQINIHIGQNIEKTQLSLLTNATCTKSKE